MEQVRDSPAFVQVEVPDNYQDFQGRRALRVGQAVLDMDTKIQPGAAGSLLAALNSQETPGVGDTLLVVPLAVLAKKTVVYIDMACDQVVWVSFESRL